MATFDFDAEPTELVPLVLPVAADIGLGKTRAWRERVAAVLVAAGKHPVLAVPRHRLGDEIVRDLAEAGITAAAYRGREAIDPEAEEDEAKMCRDFDRAELIMGALGPVGARACKHRDDRCAHFDTCSYQRQRTKSPHAWIIPHQLLFRRKPGFIPTPTAVAIDETFWSAALHGIDRPLRLWLDSLVGDRHVPQDAGATNDLIDISRRVHDALRRAGEGRLPRNLLRGNDLLPSDLRMALKYEWRRKLDLDEVHPGAPIAIVKAMCGKVAAHNQEVARLARFWELLLRTIEVHDERSPWLELREDQPPKGDPELAVRMTWRDELHEDWRAPTVVMDATMPTEIVRQFFPGMDEPISISAPMPHTYVRQIADRSMSADMLIASEGANERTNATRRANVERVRRLIEVRAASVRPGRMLVICQHGLELSLIVAGLPENVEARHFNDIAGENAWSDVVLVMVIGRTEPAPQTVERIARALFGVTITEIAPGEKGAIRYPKIIRGIRMRNGIGIAVAGAQHPDPRAEAVRWAVCEAGLVQAIGRGRGVNRTADNPLLIDILTNVVLPIEVDEVTTWERIQPTFVEIMRARGAIPLSYADMATAYPDLFSTRGSAKMAMRRKNPEQTPIEGFRQNPEQTPKNNIVSIGNCSGFSEVPLSPRR